MSRWKNDQRVWVYALADPKSHKHRYIGCSVNPEARLMAHVADAQQPQVYGGAARHTWLRSLSVRGLVPEMELLESGPPEKRFILEAAWLAECRLQGCPLTNTRQIPRTRYHVTTPGPLTVESPA